ncbi:MAG: pectate lyase [Prevotella sp.]|nr:pectate lyase [Prevotella sp.]
MKKQLLLILAALLSTTTVFSQTNAPAFPGAEGHGRYVTGGRGGKIVHVTNLNDSGTGSLREAVKGSDKKIVVFDVGGVIALNSDLSIGANTTILGQTAPYPGVTIRYYTVRPDANNVIMRFIRIRRGQEKDVNDGADAIWTRHYTGQIYDHCSFSWSIDEVASFYDNNNFTMQWCTLGESLNNAGHGKGAHGYGGIWGGKLASFHHNLIAHVNNRSPRFNGARYDWTGYTGNKLYSQYNWQNAVQAEHVDFRNCVVYNCGNGCYGGPGGGYINMVNNYYKTGPAATTSRVTTVSIGNSTSADEYPIYWDMTSRYFIKGNQVNSDANYDWTNVSYDGGVFTINGEKYCLDKNHYYGEGVTYVKNSNGDDCVKIKLDEPTYTGEVTTHTAATAFNKVLSYAGASLDRDEVDERYMTEARNGTATYSGSKTGKKGRIDLVADVNGYTEANFPTGSRPEGFDTDNDGIPDAWETANGLNPNNASDGNTYTLDPKGFYTNIEVYANSLVQDIMLDGNADATEHVDEYYPAYTKEDGTKVEAIGSETPTESKTYTVWFNGSDEQSTPDYFSFGTSENKHNFNSKFAGTYDGTSYASGLKMEGTTLIEFTTTSLATIVIVQSTWSEHTIKLDGVEIELATATTPEGSSGVRVYTIEGIAPGSHKIQRGSGESGVFYVRVVEGSSTAITKPTANGSIIATEFYDLQGRRIENATRGVIIRVDRMENGQKKVTKMVR